MKSWRFILPIFTLILISFSGCELDVLNHEKKQKQDDGPVIDKDIIQYTTLQIGNQIWMDKNLNIGEMIQAGVTASNNDVIEKYCYNNDTAFCSKYGGLYSWAELMKYNFQEGTQGICPDGWHVPTIADWQILINHLGGVSKAGGKLKEPGTTHWKSPNIISDEVNNFKAFPSGYFNAQGNQFQGIGESTFLWSSSGNGAFSWGVFLQHSDSSTVMLSNPIQSGMPLRCIKN